MFDEVWMWTEAPIRNTNAELLHNLAYLAKQQSLFDLLCCTLKSQ